MQIQKENMTFWQKLRVWGEAIESTPFDHQQSQLVKLRAEISDLSRRVGCIESKEDKCQGPGLDI